jgi:hydrogenase maturation protein HypF
LGHGDEGQDLFELDPRPLIAHLAARAGPPGRPCSEDRGALSLLFHAAIAESIVRGAVLMREETGMNTLCLSGGVFQNRLLCTLLLPRLEQQRFLIHRNRDIPAGDGGLAVGQAWYAGDGN